MTSARGDRTEDPAARSGFSRAQVFALVAGLWQVAAGATQLLPIPVVAQALQVGTGLLGLALCRRHGLARSYGVGLALVYGHLAFATPSTLLLDLPTAEALVYLRTAVSGLVIALVPSAVR
jgi:hypothetical protein